MSVGRVGNNQLTNMMLNNIREQLHKQEGLFSQISSNKRILKPSDDPIGTGQALGLRDQLTRLDQYENVIDAGDVWTNITTTSLDSASSVWTRVNELGVSAGDGTKSASDLVGIAEELEQLLQHLVQLGNTTHQGVYIFGGSETEKVPFRAEIDTQTGRITGVFYEGNNFERKIKTDDSTTVTLNTLGSNAGDPKARGAFIDTTQGVNGFKTILQLRDKLLSNDTTGISGASGILSQVQAAGNNMTAAQVRLGSAQEILDLDRNFVIEQNSNVSEFLSRIEDADIAQAILELNNAQNVYEAALAAGGRILQRGLLDYI
jgi:flagellar hook-associated protein 3 FlgL